MRKVFLPLLLAVLCTIADTARCQSPSSFQMSCSNLGVSGSTLFALCQRIDGSFNQSSIAILGIENINGQLRLTSWPQPSSYQKSCSNIGVSGSTLFAECRRIDGSSNRTSILIPGIANINGVLQYQ